MDFITNNTFDVYTVNDDGDAEDLINRFSVLITDMNEIYTTIVDPKHLLAAFCLYDIEFRKLWDAMNHQRIGGYKLVESIASDQTSQLTLRTVRREFREVYRQVRTSSICMDDKKNVYMRNPVYFPDFAYMMTEVSQHWNSAMEFCKDGDTSVVDAKDHLNNIIHVAGNKFLLVEAMESEFIVDLDENEWHLDGEDVVISHLAEHEEDK